MSSSSPSLKRELLGIALSLFAVFLAVALAAFATAQVRAGVRVETSVGWVGKILADPLVTFFGWPAAFLVPFVPAVHALRLFGRLESNTDRSWMIFFAGVVVLLPIALALTGIAPPPSGLPSAVAGLWGEFVASWWSRWFGAVGAWVVVTLAASALMAATLAWNPIRMLLGPRVARPNAGEVA
ncbi:MAG TPA: DNA translocase FtsK 4TM domain-containing protein, partial [Gemmatimonadaceae bacterium]|nr:DNA translocase FtsK 4TM domain-containing protein [Gemmatimonadaceae bacterium]